MSRPNLRELHENLSGIVKWEIFALYLPGISDDDIFVIEKNKRDDVVDQKFALYKKWLEVCPTASWKDVINALEKVKENTVAEQIKMKFPTEISAMSPKQQQIEKRQEESSQTIKVNEVVVQQLNGLNTSFLALITALESEIKQKVAKNEISIDLLKSQAREQKAFNIHGIDSIQTASEYFEAISPHYNFLNSHLIISLATTLLSTPTKEMAEAYCQELQSFKKITRVRRLHKTLSRFFPSCLSDHTKVKIEIKLVNEWGPHNLWLVEVLVKTLLGLRHPDECQWYRITPGSILLVFLIQSHLAQQFIDNSTRKRQFMKLMGVIGLQIGNKPLFKVENQYPLDFNNSLVKAVMQNDYDTTLFLLNHIEVSANTRFVFLGAIFHHDGYQTEAMNVVHKVTKLHGQYIKLIKVFKTRLFAAINEDRINTLQQVIECVEEESIDTRQQIIEKLDNEGIITQQQTIEKIEKYFELIIENPPKMTKIFLSCIERYYSFLNIWLLQYISEQICPGDFFFQSELKKYNKQLNGIKKIKEIQHVKLALESFLPTIHPDIITIEIRLTETWKKFSMANAEILIERIFSSHYSNKCQWYRVYTEPMTIVFTVHNSYLMLLIVNSVKVIEPMKQWGVISLKIGTICVSQKCNGTYTCSSKERAQTILGSLSTTTTILYSPAQLKERKMYTKTNDSTDSIAQEGIKDTVLDDNNNRCINYDNNSSLLMIACCNDSTELAKLLLDKGADPDAVNANGWTALMYASIVGNVRLVNMLLTHSATPEITNVHNETALSCASLVGNTNVVQQILNEAARIPNTKISIALFNAARKNHLETVKTILQSQNYDTSSITQVTTFDDKLALTTPLYIASKKGHLKIVEELLKANADPNTKCYRKDKEYYYHNEATVTPLYAATKRGHKSIVETLLFAHADPNGGTSAIKPLIRASYEGHTQIVKLLLKAGANPDEVQVAHQSFKPFSPHPKTTTALHIACENGHLAVVDVLLKNGASPDMVPQVRMTSPLEIAVAQGFLKIVEKLLITKANPDGPVRETNTSTPLYTAALNGNLPMMKLLLEGGADPNIPLIIYIERQPYRYMAHANSKVVLLLLDANADPHYKAKSGNTLLHIAAAFGYTDVVIRLLSEDVDVNAVNSDGNTPLYKAAVRGHSDIVDILLKHNADPNCISDYGYSSLQFAATFGHIDVLKRLLKEDIDVNKTDDQGYTALYCAVKAGRSDIVHILLKHNADPNCISDYGYSSLQIAATFGRIDVLKRLLKEDIDVNEMDYQGYTALYCAVKAGRSDIVHILLKHNADPNIQQHDRSVTPLHLSILLRYNTISKTLLEHNASTDKVTDIEEINLDLRQEKNILQFLKSKRDPDYTNESSTGLSGFTPLHIATMFDDMEMVQLLINHKADKTIKNSFGQTPLMTAQLLQYRHIANLLQ